MAAAIIIIIIIIIMFLCATASAWWESTKNVTNSIYPLGQVREYDASLRVRRYNALVSGTTVQKF
jgi:uncharacterized protein YpmB